MPPAEESRDPRRVREMFGGIARRYDLLNRVLSLARDRSWRRDAADEAAAAGPGPVLDLCGGTGDLAVEIARRTGGPVVCADFAAPMLRRAAPKFRRAGVGARCALVEADALRLPFADRSFAAVAVAFGVRNWSDPDAGYREALRVLRPGGRLVVLEFSRPEGRLFGPLYRFYLRRVLPRIGDTASGREGPYLYLARTIAAFPDPATLAGRIREAGFAAVGWKLRSGGIVAIHTAMKA